MREGWEKQRLIDIAKFIDYRGRTPKKTDSGIRLITAKNVKMGVLNRTPEEFIAEEDYDDWMTRGIPKRGDVLFTTEAPLAMVTLLDTDEKIALAQRIITLCPNRKILSGEYLNYCLQSKDMQDDILSKGTGATVTGIKSKLLKEVLVPFPSSLKEQKQIVITLDKAFKQIDQAKVNLEKNLNNAKELFQSKLNEVFSQRGEGWEEKRLGDMCNIVGGGTPSKSNQSFYDGKILWATVRDMKKDILVDTQLKITKEGLKSSSSNIILAGNVIIATRVGLGKVCLLNYDTAINQDLKGIVVKEKFTISNKFIFWWFKSIAKNIISTGTGLTVQGVKLTYIKSLQFPYIPSEEQEQIVDLLDNLDEKSEQLQTHYQQKLNNLEELKKSILKKAFKGELAYQ